MLWYVGVAVGPLVMLLYAVVVLAMPVLTKGVLSHEGHGECQDKSTSTPGNRQYPYCLRRKQRLASGLFFFGRLRL